MRDFLDVSRKGQILEIVIDRPKANALDAPASREMGRVCAEFRDDPELRVAILTGAGEKFFSGGWDLTAVAGGEEYLEDFGEGGFGGFVEMTDLLKPVICAVNGLAVGAGFEMLLRADFVVAHFAPGTVEYRSLRRCGFLPAAGQGMRFTVRPLDGSLAGLSSPAAWDLSLGDLVIF